MIEPVTTTNGLYFMVVAVQSYSCRSGSVSLFISKDNYVQPKFIGSGLSTT